MSDTSNVTDHGRITHVIFDASSMPENYTPAFNVKAHGLDVEEMRKNPVVMNMEDGQVATTSYEVKDNATTTATPRDVSLIARYVRDNDDPKVVFSVKCNDSEFGLEIFLEDVKLKDVATAKVRGIPPQAFIAQYFEDQTIKADEMFYLRLAQQIDQKFTVLLHDEISKIIASQPEPAAPPPSDNSPIFH